MTRLPRLMAGDTDTGETVKILVTGGAGYIGTALIDALSHLPRDITEIIVYDNLSRKNHNFFLGSSLGSAVKIRFIQGDILDTRRLEQAMAGVSVVVHLAARVTTPFSSADPHLFEQVNHWGSAELSYILERVEGVRQLIYLSSTSVYGSAGGAASHTTTPMPQSWYGTSKLRGEKMLERLSDRMAVHIIRCGNVYGYSRSMRFDAVINRFVFEAHFTGRISIHGDGDQGRAFIHVDHAADALSALIGDDLPSGVYNLIDRNATISEVAAELVDLIDGLEMIYIEQDMPRHNLMVRPDPRILARGWFSQRPLRDELVAFRERLAFSPG
jgi:UDP-glucose 4-epimerase